MYVHTYTCVHVYTHARTHTHAELACCLLPVCSLTEQYEWAASRGIRWLVILDPAKLGKGALSSGASSVSSKFATTDTGQRHSACALRGLDGQQVVKVGPSVVFHHVPFAPHMATFGHGEPSYYLA